MVARLPTLAAVDGFFLRPQVTSDWIRESTCDLCDEDEAAVGRYCYVESVMGKIVTAEWPRGSMNLEPLLSPLEKMFCDGWRRYSLTSVPTSSFPPAEILPVGGA